MNRSRIARVRFFAMHYLNESGFTRTLFIMATVILAFVYLTFVLNDVGKKAKTATVTLGGKNFSTEVVRTSEERRKGLSGRESIPESGGMLFQFPTEDIYPFWMKDMRFPIDILWLDKRLVVFFVKSAVPPIAGTPDSALQVFTPDKVANEVLELRTGTIERLHISAGDEVLIEVK